MSIAAGFIIKVVDWLRVSVLPSNISCCNRWDQDQQGNNCGINLLVDKEYMKNNTVK